MHRSSVIMVAFAALAIAQDRNNVVNNPEGGIQATAGEPLTLSWETPSQGPITIKLQSTGAIQSDDGIVVAEGIENTGAATFVVPENVPQGEVFVQIIDEEDPDNFNFSGGFEVQGASAPADENPARTATAVAEASALPSDATVDADLSATASAPPEGVTDTPEDDEDEEEEGDEGDEDEEPDDEDADGEADSDASATPAPSATESDSSDSDPTSSSSSEATSVPDSNEDSAASSAFTTFLGLRTDFVAAAVTFIAGVILL